MIEIWKPVVGYEGLYEVSNLGRVKSLNYNHTGKEGILSLKPNGKGYIIITLCKNNIKKPYSVHRLVAQAFIPNPNNLPEVNHIDEDKENNCVGNLEWCDRTYNVNYGTRNERDSEKKKGKYLGDKHPRAKKIKCITTNEIFTTIKEASDKYKIWSQHISACCKGKRNYAGKHPITSEKMVWEYID